MPPKVRELESRLRKSGFQRLEGKGSHRKWFHPKGIHLVISGKSGADAKPYQEKQVEEAIKKAER